MSVDGKKSVLISPLRIGKGAPALICPPDKSITHRAFLFSLLSRGKSVVTNPLFGEDCLASLEAVRKLGAAVRRIDPNRIEIKGFGIGDFNAASPLTLDCQNSGTTMRLLTGLLAGQRGMFRLLGDESLSARPMGRVSKPLTEMGAHVHPQGQNKKGAPCPPVEIDGTKRSGALRPIRYDSPVASAQVKSAILLAGLWCDPGEKTQVSEPVLSRDHTERMLRGMGVEVGSQREADGRARASLMGKGGSNESLTPLNIRIGGDPSSAAFWACASILQQASIRIEGMLLNPTRLGFVEVLKRMGANVRLEKTSIQAGEEIGVIEVEKTSRLQAAEVEASEVPSLVDEVPMLAIASLWARGTSIFRGVQELRVKESDRLAEVIAFIQAIGGRAWAEGDDLHVEGLDRAPEGPKAASWSYATRGDHRLAMAAIVTADALQKEIVLDDVECIKVSYPNFFDHRTALARSSF